MESRVKVLQKVWYLICFSVFTVWLFLAIENYKSWPTVTNYKVKYGDDGNKKAKFPLVSICRLPTKVDDEMRLWQETNPCANLTKLSEPYFLSYLETCLESNIEIPVIVLMKSISYDEGEAIQNVLTLPKDKIVDDNKTLYRIKKKIVTSKFHFNYGHCHTIDISMLSDDCGMFPIEYGSAKTTLYIDYLRSEKNPIYQYYFLHESHDEFHQFGKDLTSYQFAGGEVKVRV